MIPVTTHSVWFTVELSLADRRTASGATLLGRPGLCADAPSKITNRVRSTARLAQSATFRHTVAEPARRRFERWTFRMATPADPADFALGFSLDEGVVAAAAEIGALDIVATYLKERPGRGDERQALAKPAGLQRNASANSLDRLKTSV